jgi:hypothetical protein
MVSKIKTRSFKRRIVPDDYSDNGAIYLRNQLFRVIAAVEEQTQRRGSNNGEVKS